MARYFIPEFKKSLRDEILNWTDDKSHQSMIRAVDADTEVVILAGGKGCGKSFAFPCVAVYNILADPNYNCIMARNLKIDIKNTIRATLIQFLTFLKLNHNVDLLRLFEIQSEEVRFKPTGQKIFFENFEKQSAFAGFALENPGGYIGDVFLDEIMQKRSTFGDKSDAYINSFYERQREDMDTLKKATIYRYPNKTGRTRHLYMSMNLWEPNHWVVKDYFDKVMPLGPQNYKELEEKKYIFKSSPENDCTILRLSKFYVPASEIDERIKKDAENTKKNNYPLYVATILGDAFLEPNTSQNYYFRNFIFSGTKMNTKLFFNVADLKKEDVLLYVDGFDPALRDMNGLTRIAISKNWEIFVLSSNEFPTSKHAKYKRQSMVQFITNKINHWNNLGEIKSSLLAIDAKDDAVIELCGKYVLEKGYSILVVPAVKNKNKNFRIDFSIPNRLAFLNNCLQLGIIHFARGTESLLKKLALMVVDENGERDEKIHAEIYDQINSFEYALSLVYKRVIQAHNLGMGGA